MTINYVGQPGGSSTTLKQPWNWNILGEGSKLGLEYLSAR